MLRKSKKRLPEDVDMQEGEPLDLLDVKKTREVLSAVRKPKQVDSDDEPDFDMDGRLIVDENKDRNRKRARNDSDDEDDDTKSRGGRSSASRRSQGRDSTKGTRRGPKEVAGGRKKAKTGTKSWAYTGEDYANQKGKGGGDVKRDGKFEPYAYWPLDPKLLNRRDSKKAAARQGMSSVLKKGKQQRGGGGSKAANSKVGAPKKGPKIHKGKGKQKDRK